jgi:signal transduction histidine kinase
MFTLTENILAASSFMPHGMCYLWRPGLVTLHLVSNATVALSYFSIPVTIVHIVRKRKDIPFNWIPLLFAAFIIFCGIGHLMDIWTLWHPNYWLSGYIRFVTGIISFATAAALVYLIPKIMAMPSSAQMEEANKKLLSEINERKQAQAELAKLNQELEERVIKRTVQLEAANSDKDKLIERERAAKAEIELYKDVIENIPLGCCIWHLQNKDDITSFQLVAANPAACNIFGIPLQAEIGKLMGECFPNMLHQEHRLLLENYAEVLITQQTKIFENINYDDNRIQGKIFAVKAFPLPNNLLGVAFENITERKQNEKIIEARASELATLNTILLTTTAQLERRNNELDEFAYVASHDLKAPLRAIANLSEWIEEDLEDKLTEDTRYQMSLLRSRVHRMEALIDGILEYSRVGRIKNQPEEVAVSSLLTEIIDSIDPPPEFVIEIQEEMPTLVTERLPLQQVFTNLISNAIKHHNRPDGKVKISIQDVGKFYQFAVTDDGPGIAAEYQDKVFAIFQTLESRDKSDNTGIGLSIVKKIIENQGGKIQIESQIGQGTTFRFTWVK